MGPKIWTDEQNEILSTETEFLLIKAFAGTGKTTVLSEYARRRANKTFFYTSFNSHIIDEAKSSGKFGENTKIQNVHSYAYKKVGYLYKHKLKKDINYKEIIDILMLDDNQESIMISKMIKNIITDYCFSHIKEIDKFINTVKMNQNIRGLIKEFSNIVWENLIDTQNEYGITHDIYLKIFCNNDPVLNFDYILFDEAQDANDALKFLFVNQIKHNKKVIFVGDTHQSIYSFRGTKNILKTVIPTEVKYLTHSFRFGKNIANAANKILNKKSESKRITGFEKIKDRVGKVDFSKKFAVIARSNVGVLSRAINLIGKDKKLYFLGGITNYDFYKAKDVEHLYHNRIDLIKNLEVFKYKSFKDLLDKAELNDDTDLLNYAHLVLSHKGNLIPKINMLENITTTNKREANVLLTTVHKSKGLEFNQVVLANDYIKLSEDDIPENCDTIKKEEEINNIYVAITRARVTLELNENLKKIK